MSVTCQSTSLQPLTCPSLQPVNTPAVNLLSAHSPTVTVISFFTLTVNCQLSIRPLSHLSTSCQSTYLSIPFFLLNQLSNTSVYSFRYPSIAVNTCKQLSTILSSIPFACSQLPCPTSYKMSPLRPVTQLTVNSPASNPVICHYSPQPISYLSTPIFT